MKKAILTAVGFLAFVFLVFRPLESNFKASIAKRLPLSNLDKEILLNEANNSDHCNLSILELLGDTYVLDQKPIMAATTYGEAMICSPGNSLMRFKFGEALLMLGFIEGKNSIQDAWMLEPNNPIYKAELNRLMGIQSQSQ